MAYEKRIVYAIQRLDVDEFTYRFRTFISKELRDSTFAILKERQNPELTALMCPVKLTVTVETDEDNQLALPLGNVG